MSRLWQSPQRSADPLASSIADFEMNVHTRGRNILDMPKDFAGDGRPKCFFMTRELYERLLRRLVCNYSKRIRWQTATVTELIVDSNDPGRLSAVKIRNPDATEQLIPASLVIGKFRTTLQTPDSSS